MVSVRSPTQVVFGKRMILTHERSSRRNSEKYNYKFAAFEEGVERSHHFFIVSSKFKLIFSNLNLEFRV